MSKLLEKRLARLHNHRQARFLRGGLKGLEKESLRVSPSGIIAQTDHPHALGAPLTHPHITTDYSEALLEFVTPPFADVSAAITFLSDIHHFVLNHMEHDEMLWNASMPCVVRGDESIRIAKYGRTHAAKMKEVYRVGLGHRYGRVMQTIAGVHFNYSVPERFWPIYQHHEKHTGTTADFVSRSYFDMSRNALRFGWLLLYLFGSSPAICKSFLGGIPHGFEPFDEHTFYEPYATSLRMSDIGYQNDVPDALNVSFNRLDEYVAGLNQAIRTPHPAYSHIGVLVDGAYRQLNDHILQIENEFYRAIRPKQVGQGERPAVALAKYGVGYVELRAIDVNPYSPVGVTADQLYFFETFLLFCLLHKSPPLTAVSLAEIEANDRLVTRWGRKPGLELRWKGKPRPLQKWARKLLKQMRAIAEILDGHDENKPYTAALKAQETVLADPSLTPSAQILAEMRTNKEAFYHFAKRLSQRHEQAYRARPLPPALAQQFTQLATESHHKLAQLEAEQATSDQTFAQYLAQYFST